MSDSEVYSIGESSGYSYQDLAVYQYSDDEAGDQPSNKRPVPTYVYEEEDDDGEFNNWNDYDNDSYVMHAQSDDDDDIDLYQFSDEDLIPEEPDEEWIVAALLNNRPDFDHLELMLEAVEDFPRLIEAIDMNRVIKNVTIYEQFFDAIPTGEEKTILAETICQLSNLQQLRVFYHSSYFVEPLERYRPPLLKRLCLMFFPERANKATLGCLTRILKDEGGNVTKPTAGETHEAAAPPAQNVSMLDSIRIRCNVMDDDFIDAIAQGMEVNPTISILSFWGNKVEVTEKGAEGSAKIDFFLRLNQCGIRDLHLLVNATPTEFLNKIVEERESLDLVFYLLQTNPSFVSYSTCLK